MADEDTSTQEEHIRDEIRLFLQKNFPQIQMHGGIATITELDIEENHVAINLGDACNGCGLSPMTTRALKDRMTDELDTIESVSVSIGLDGLGDETERNESPDAPF